VQTLHGTYIEQLVDALEESADGDGCHLGPTDSILVAKVLRMTIARERRRRALSASLAIASIVVALGSAVIHITGDTLPVPWSQSRVD